MAAGRRDHLRVFGQDYPTPDGTGIRDYLHDGPGGSSWHNPEHLLNQPAPCHCTLNIGTGRGLSVLDVVRGFEQAMIEIPSRSLNDVLAMYRNWKPVQSKRRRRWAGRHNAHCWTCRDGWAWQQANPLGTGLNYETQWASATAGGGHSHALVLKRWAMYPRSRPDMMIVLINRCSTCIPAWCPA